MTDRKPHILIIDDDKEITWLLDDFLTKHHFRVTYRHNGDNLSRLMSENHFDLVILDVMLPGEDGLSLCRTIRKTHDLPIIMLSAAQTEADRVLGLELGADDYIVKPFSPRELLARIKAHLRRNSGELQRLTMRIAPLKKIRFAKWCVDRETHSLIDENNVAHALSQREYDLLLIFLEHPKRVLSRSQLMDLLYDKEMSPFDRSIDVLIGRLRKKIEDDVKSPKLLCTVRGGGYMLESKVEIDK